MVPHGLEKRWLRAYGQHWTHPMPLINKVIQCDGRAVLVAWIHKWALFGDLVSPRPRGAAGLCPMQQLLPCSQPQLHSQLPAQSQGCNPTLRCTSTSVRLGWGPEFIPGEPCFQPLSLVGPQRAEGLLRPHGALLQRTAPFTAHFTCSPSPGCPGNIPLLWGQESGALTEAEKKSWLCSTLFCTLIVT